MDVNEQYVLALKDNGLLRGKGEQEPLAPKSVRNVHGILTKALATAVQAGYLKANPAAMVTLPRVEKKEIHPLDDQPAPFVMDILEARRREEAEQRLRAGPAWVGWSSEKERETAMVFTTASGSNLSPQTVYNHDKKLAEWMTEDSAARMQGYISGLANL